VDLRPTDEQRQLVGAFAAVFADMSTPEDVQAAEPLGHAPPLWDAVRAMDGVAMAVPEGRGGGGGTLLDLALVAEQVGRTVAPVPLLDAQVAARLLAGLDGAAAHRCLTEAVEGGRLVTLAVVPADGGRATLVPAGAIADHALVLDSDRLLLVALDAADRSPVHTLGCLPVADIAVPAGSVVLLEGPAAVAAFEHAVDEWRVLTAAALAGLALRALEIGVEYVGVRKAFGKVIGEFQGIAHRLADRKSECDGAQLLARKAAWAHDVGDVRASELAAMALGFAAETARATTQNALHFHGGYGFMLEYAIQLYWRRARSWAAVLEDSAASYRLVADRRSALGIAS
jgi:alkylation response protein AidB-like acyl-CoA dehydrogenase